jgi:predicted site-specific integrase-resolvase
MSEGVHWHPKLLKENEAADRLSLEVATLRRWRWSGKGPRFLKIGGAVRYETTDLDAFIEASRRCSTSAPANIVN